MWLLVILAFVVEEMLIVLARWEVAQSGCGESFASMLLLVDS